MEYISNFPDKESIRERMNKFAVNYLALSESELRDPSICLLIDALAEDVYRVSGEIGNIEDRMLEKLSGILSSKTAVVATPSDAILHASSQEQITHIGKETGFEYIGKQLKRSQQKESLSFYPVCNTNIYNGDVRYLVSNGLFYQVDTDQTKTLLARPRTKDYKDSSSFWIGLELDEGITSLKELSFYFDFAGVEHKANYLNLLQYARWTINNQAIGLRQGLSIRPSVYENAEQQLFASFEITTVLDQKTLDKYNKHFITITEDIDPRDLRQHFPEELKKDYLDKFPADFDQALIWIKVSCTETIKANVIDQIGVSINAFPVVNKKLYTSIKHVSKMGQIIPLRTEDYEFFIAVHSITDSRGQVYAQLPFNDTENTRYKTYSIRRGGFERFNTRDGRDALHKTIEELLAETAEANTAETDLNQKRGRARRILGIVTQMKRIASVITEHREKTSYVMLDTFEEDEIFFVKYWVTACDRANDIMVGTSLQSLTEAGIKNASVKLLTTTSAGRRPPREDERRQSYRHVLTERHIIVTKEDILSYCKLQFKDTIKHVEIKTGISCSLDPKEDLLKTIDVYLTPQDELKSLFKHPESGDQFKQELCKQSPQVYNYRVIMNVD